MAETTAWILKLTEDLRVAVGEQQMLHLVDNPVLEDAPDDIYYCRGLLHWQGEMLVVLDLDAWLNDTPAQAGTRLVGIFTFIDPANSMPRFVALAIDNIPVRKQINDNQACALPHELSVLATYSIACFSDAGHAIPVLNLSAIFAEKGLAVDTTSLRSLKPVNASTTCVDMLKESDCNNMDITSLVSPENNSLNVN